VPPPISAATPGDHSLLRSAPCPPSEHLGLSLSHGGLEACKAVHGVACSASCPVSTATRGDNNPGLSLGAGAELFSSSKQLGATPARHWRLALPWLRKIQATIDWRARCGCTEDDSRASQPLIASATKSSPLGPPCASIWQLFAKHQSGTLTWTEP
jgi:hypothetical protein